MRAGRRSAFSPRKLLLWLAPLAWLGCGGGTDVVLPSLSVSTSTTGAEPDPDGYSVVVDDGQGQPIGPAATLIVERLPDGAHSVALAGLAANCAAADNPRGVTVQSGATANVAFTVTCSATSGTIEVTTTTSGPGSDPDGFALLLDGADRGLIEVSATASLTGLTPGPHTLGLNGLAANCQVTGENPRSVTVMAGQVASVPFAVTCAQPPPTAGSVQITTATSGSPPDPDGYNVNVDGSAGQVIGANTSLTIGGIAPGVHRVGLTGIAPNCSLTGDNPRSVTVSQGQTVAASFSITCAAPGQQTGSVQITAATSGSSLDADGYTVTVDNGNAQPIAINGSQTVGNLSAGSHSVQLGGVANNCSVTGDNPRQFTITAGQTASVAYTVTCGATGSSVNFRTERLYLTQSVQRLAGDVPLVQGRDAFLRVFVTASNSTTPRAKVRVRFFTNGTLTETKTIAASGGPTPTSVDESELSNSWNLRVAGSLVQPGLAILADVDPDNSVNETNEGDNAFPASNDPGPVSVQPVQTAAIRFVPVRQGTGGPVGNVSSANKDQLVDLTRRIYPLHDIQTDVHAVYTTSSGPLDPQNADGSWGQVLGEIEALRVTENSGRTYYGMVKLDYDQGIVGIGFVGDLSSSSPRAALGWDNPSDARRVVAHELGHTWGQLHTPCNNPPGIDPNYPYPAGNIGVYGYDVTSGTLESPYMSDIMGYCSSPWVSDYTYQRILAFRRSQQPAGTAVAGLVQPCVLVWGRIENGQAVLEPAFQVVTRPHLPARPGPYGVQAAAADGTSIFSLSFDAPLVADDPRGSRHFAFAVPIDPARAARLDNMRLSGPGAPAARMSQSVAPLQRTAVADKIIARREPGGMTLEWNAVAHPMIMVRDPDTGEVLSFARGGKTRVLTAKPTLELNVSDGVQSYRLRRAISRR